MIALLFGIAFAQEAAPASPPAVVSDDVVLINWAEAEVRVRASVRESDYPAEARDLDLDARCVVHLRIDEQGTPYEAELDPGCPAVFHDSARAIAFRYRFFPVKRAGTPVKAQFDLTINFKGPGGSYRAAAAAVLAEGEKTTAPDVLRAREAALGSVAVDASEVALRGGRRPTRRDVPDAVLGLPTASRTCVVRVFADAKGTPVSALPVRCLARLVDPTLLLAMDLRFRPVRRDDEAVPVAFDLAVTYTGTRPSLNVAGGE